MMFYLALFQFSFLYNIIRSYFKRIPHSFMEYYWLKYSLPDQGFKA